MIDAIVIGAASALLVSAVGWRWSSAGRVLGVQSRPPESGARVRSGTPDAGRGHPSRVRDLGDRIPGPGAEVSASLQQLPLFCNSHVVPPPIEHGVGFLPAMDHITEFIAWAITDEDGERHRVRYRNAQMVANYLG